jgi:hypothetical protein
MMYSFILFKVIKRKQVSKTYNYVINITIMHFFFGFEYEVLFLA